MDWIKGIFKNGLLFILSGMLFAAPVQADSKKKPVAKTEAARGSKTKPAAAKPQPEGAKEESNSAANLKSIFGGEGKEGSESTYIKSETLTLNSKDRVFTYKGNVEIIRGDLRITADNVIGTYDDKNQLQKVICEDNVVLTRGEDLRATGNRAVYSVPLATVEMTENPELTRRGSQLTADKITVYVNKDRSEAEGNVRVKVVQTDDATGITAAKQRFVSGKRKEDNKEEKEEINKDKEAE